MTLFTRTGQGFVLDLQEEKSFAAAIILNLVSIEGCEPVCMYSLS